MCKCVALSTYFAPTTIAKWLGRCVLDHSDPRAPSIWMSVSCHHCHTHIRPCWHWQIPSYTLFETFEGHLFQPSTITVGSGFTSLHTLHAYINEITCPPPKQLTLSGFEIICPPWPCAKDTRRDVVSWLVENDCTLLRSKLFPIHSTSNALFEASCPLTRGAHLDYFKGVHSGVQWTLAPDTFSVRGTIHFAVICFPGTLLQGGPARHHVHNPYWGLRFSGWGKINLASEF